MRHLFLRRTSTGDAGTFGEFSTDTAGQRWFSVELPWRFNLPGKSCIPVGEYLVHWRLSPAHGWCYHVDGVPGRSDIEIHPANFAGDREKGLKCELLGCIALGKTVAELAGQEAVIQSREAMAEFVDAMRQDDAMLTIEWADAVDPTKGGS